MNENQTFAINQNHNQNNRNIDIVDDQNRRHQSTMVMIINDDDDNGDLPVDNVIDDKRLNQTPPSTTINTGDNTGPTTTMMINTDKDNHFNIGHYHQSFNDDHIDQNNQFNNESITSTTITSSSLSTFPSAEIQPNNGPNNNDGVGVGGGNQLEHFVTKFRLVFF